MKRIIENKAVLPIFLIGLVLFAFFTEANAAQRFVPIDPIMPLDKVHPGMVGEARTVVSGTKISSFPIRVIGILPRDETPKNLIVIRAEAPYMTESDGIAQGMSGSPVYIDGKLIGAIGYGWPFTDSRLGMVTPIEEMMEILSWKDNIPSFLPPTVVSDDPISADKAEPRSVDAAAPPKVVPELSADLVAALQKETLRPLLPPLMVSGISPAMTAQIGTLLGRELYKSGGQTNSGKKENVALLPGASIGAVLAWGDLTVGAIGTLTTTTKDGRFVAFAHPFLERGATATPVTDSTILKVVPSQMTSFKLGYLGSIRGLITQDRRAGIGGRFGQLAPAVSCVLRFHDVDTKTQWTRRFQMVQDPFLLSQLAPMLFQGSAEELWGRKGQGTARTTTRFTGTPLPPKGWERSNVFFSDKDIIAELGKELTQLANLIALNPFQEVGPLGVEVEIQVSSDPRVLLIQKIELDKKDSYKPGDKIEGTILFRGWRKQPFQRRFSVVVPEKIAGLAELVVRAGGIEEDAPDSLMMGWRSIRNLKELLGEVDARETNDLVVVEIRGQQALPDRGKKPPTPEDIMDDKLQAELRQEKLKEGSMRILRTNYYVHGLIRELLQIGDSGESAKGEGHAVARPIQEKNSAPKSESSPTSDEPSAQERSKRILPYGRGVIGLER